MTEPENLQEEVEKLKAQTEEYLNGWKRERADFLNYKKDEMERIGQLVKYANEEIISNVLPILDNLERAEKELPEDLKSGTKGDPQAIEWTKGFLQIAAQLKDFLQKQGIEPIEVIGKKFDPNVMDIVEEVEGATPGIVIEELEAGYTMNGKIIRPAKVKVSK